MDKGKGNLWDVIVIGAGIAGASAGMYCGRFNLKTLVIGEMPGGVITTTHLVENYPGILSIEGAEMGEVFLEHAKKFGAQMKFAKAVKIEKTSEPRNNRQADALHGGAAVFKIKTSNEEFLSRTLIFATGTEHKKLGVSGEKELYGKGVSYCALCDAAFFRGKTVGIVGGGDSSAIEALILAQQCKKVYMFVRRDVLRAEPVNHKKIMGSKNIEVRFKTEIAEIRGSNKVDSVLLKSGEKLDLDGFFIAVGYEPASGLAKELGVELDEKRQIKINRTSQTNVPGVFAAGDVCDSAFKQAITGAAEAVSASYSAYKYLQGV